jgi:hypothetical protein
MSDIGELDMFGNRIAQAAPNTLSEKFIYPPFSVLNAREGWWQERKRAWLALGIKSELGRGCNDANRLGTGGGGDVKQRMLEGEGTARERRMDSSPGGSPRPACNYKNRQRGNGSGWPL